jgi:hypothetical protein
MMTNDSMKFFNKWLDTQFPGQRQYETKDGKPYFVLVRETRGGYLVLDNRGEPTYWEVSIRKMLADIEMSEALAASVNIE